MVPPAIDHASRHGLASQEAGKAGHFPDLEVFARGFLKDAARHIGADVENEGFNRADAAFDLLDKGSDVFFLARVEGETMGLATLCNDAVYQGLQLVGAAPGHAGNVAFAGKAFGDLAAGGIASADDQHHLVFGCLRIHAAPLNNDR